MRTGVQAGAVDEGHGIVHGKLRGGGIVVIKCGGSLGSETDALIADVGALRAHGWDVVVVHGGGAEITSWLRQLGLPTEFARGQRVTTQPVLEVAEMVLCGSVGKRLARAFAAAGIPAASVAGGDAQLLSCVPLDPTGALGFVGRVTAVDPQLLAALLGGGIVPVVAPIAVDETCSPWNVNADQAAAAIAAGVGAHALVLATDVAGVLAALDVDAAERATHETASLQSRSVVAEITADEARQLIAAGVATGGMIPKLEAAVEAVVGGVHEAWIADGRLPGSVARAVLGDGPASSRRMRPPGTRIVASEAGTVRAAHGVSEDPRAVSGGA
jgi:acetylglutamate kinase